MSCFQLHNGPLTSLIHILHVSSVHFTSYMLAVFTYFTQLFLFVISYHWKRTIFKYKNRPRRTITEKQKIWCTNVDWSLGLWFSLIYLNYYYNQRIPTKGHSWTTIAQHRYWSFPDFIWKTWLVSFVYNCRRK